MSTGPRVGPRELVNEADLAILAAHRDEVLAALEADLPDDKSMTAPPGREEEP